MKLSGIKLTIQIKILAAFGAILFLILSVSIANYIRVNNVSELEERLLSLRLPTVITGLQLTDGIHLSLSGLRGYMILGKAQAAAEKFKAERQQGWELINNSLDEMEMFSKNWTDPENIGMLQDLKGLISEFRLAQEEIENIAHSGENIPAFELLLSEAAPRAAVIINALTEIIDEESSLAATTERKALLKLLADSRGSFAISLANIRAYLLSGDTKFVDQFNSKWKINELRFNEILGVTYLFNSKQKELWETYKTYRNEFAALPPEMFSLRSADDWNRANYWLGKKAAPKASAIMQILTKMRASQDKLAILDEEALKSQASMMKMTMIIGTLIMFAFGLYIAITISRMISVPLRTVVDRAKAIADGDLTGNDIEVKNEDELGELTTAVNVMSHNLSSIISDVSSSSMQIASASEELSSITEQSSESNREQQSQTEQVATAMNEMSATVQEIATNISGTAEAAEQASKYTISGSRVVDGAIQEIQQLGEQIENAASVIYKLEKKSNDISSVLDVIKSVADQTNLLALNAAIEAARAGEQGRGFAVVADEVRSLASKTQESTIEINQVIEELQSGTRMAVDVMNNSISKTKNVVEEATKTDESLTSISSSVEHINAMSTQIASAAEQQSATTEEINRNIITISDMGSQSATSFQEVVVASENLAELGSHLQSLMSRFKT